MQRFVLIHTKCVYKDEARVAYATARLTKLVICGETLKALGGKQFIQL